MKSITNELKIKKIVTIIKFVSLLLIILGIPLLLYITNKEIFDTLETFEDFIIFIKTYDKAMIALFFIQLIQTIISIIPGQAIDIAAAYLFGFVPALLLTVTGVLIGTSIDYKLGQVFGKDFLELIFKKEKIESYYKLLNSKKGIIACFIVYLIPGYPKDIFNYVSGASSMKFKYFIIASTFARMFGIVGSLIMGRLLVEKNYSLFIIIGIVGGILLLIGIIFRKKIMDIVEK